MAIVTHSADTALWFDVVHDAEKVCLTSLEQSLEAYLVNLLMRHVRQSDFVSQIVSIDFLNALSASHPERINMLRKVGDHCLLFSGLYPKIAEKRRVRISYFVGIGQSAYSSSAYDKDDLYTQLAHEFVSLMDILQAIRSSGRDMPNLLPLEAWELWNDTGSKRALDIFKQYTRATPVNLDDENQ